MVRKNSSHDCQAADPATCRYHKPNAQAQLKEAQKTGDYAAFEKAKKSLETEAATSNKDDKSFVHNPEFRNIKKMPALFVIDRQAHMATTELNPSASWIFEEPAKATLKKDGTSITVTEDGTVYARRSVKKGKKAPPGFISAEVDSYTGHAFGLEPVEQSGFNKMYAEAANGKKLAPGTYELCGPKINGNPENLDTPELIAHGSDVATEIPDMRTMPREEAYEKLKAIFTNYQERGIEGVVWWGSDGKRAKLRVKDFFGDPFRS